ncbi:MAG: AAA family ATPase [Bacteroidales bacterium]|nr:AAA family ATPase [Bacteroidales bacterium]
MYREASDFLQDWKARKNRKPLIIRGARQVGKTFLVEQFASDFDLFIRINFEENPEFKVLFQTNDVKTILENLSFEFRTKIEPEKTLLFLDEIQACPEAIPALRYFYEKVPELFLIAAGSLLDHVLNEMNYSMPVGRVEFLYVHPLSFKEFLIAGGENLLVNYLSLFNTDKTITHLIHEKLLKLLRTYFFVGGMPEAVKTYFETSDLLEVERVHESILTSMELDFTKYTKNNQAEYLRRVFRYVPRGIGNKVKYVNIDRSVKSIYLKQAFTKLEMSRIVHRIMATSSAAIPLENNLKEDVFKPLFFDIGLASHILKVRLRDLGNLMLLNEGTLAEQFIGQQLLCRQPFFIDRRLFYWNREKRDASAEIDYLVEIENKVIPIEVKAGKTGSLKSLQVFVAEKQKDFAIRFNTDLPSLTEANVSLKFGNTVKPVTYNLLSLPLYMVGFIDEIPGLQG